MQVAVHEDQVAYLAGARHASSRASRSRRPTCASTTPRRCSRTSSATSARSPPAQLSGSTSSTTRAAQTAGRRSENVPVPRRHDRPGGRRAELRQVPARPLRREAPAASTRAARQGRRPGRARSAVAGYPIRLTIDISLQRAAERALAVRHQPRARGQPLARERRRDRGDEPVRTARSSRWPRRRRTSRASSSGATDPEEARAAPRPDDGARTDNYPGLDRVTEGLYPPGSTFKPVTALAAMQERLISPFQTIPCTPSFERARRRSSRTGTRS